MPEIFINYRTADEKYAATAIDRDLAHRFGPERVFFAGRSVRPGEIYKPKLLHGARTCAVLLAVIGPKWLEPDAQGRSLLNNHEDWVRREILAAFESGGCVIPVLVDRPRKGLSPADLPKDLAPLAERQSVSFSNHSAESDLDKISGLISDLVPGLVDRSRVPHAADPQAPAGTGNVIHGSATLNGSTIQGRDISYHQSGQSGGLGIMTGGTIGNFINDSKAPLNTGSGNQYNGPMPRSADTAGDDEA